MSAESVTAKKEETILFIQSFEILHSSHLSPKTNCKLLPAPTKEINIGNTLKAFTQVLRTKAEVIAFVAFEHQVICVYVPSVELCKQPYQ